MVGGRLSIVLVGAAPGEEREQVAMQRSQWLSQHSRPSSQVRAWSRETSSPELPLTESYPTQPQRSIQQSKADIVRPHVDSTYHT